MPKYQTAVSWTEDHQAVMEFECPEDKDPMDVLNESLPPLDNLKILEVILVSAGDATLN